jgi:hypothetical protein
VADAARPDGAELARQARAAARERAEGAVRELAARFGSRTLARLRSHPTARPDHDIPRLEAAAFLEAAHGLDRAAHELVGRYLRVGREAGLTWEMIGDALDLRADASANKIGVGEQARDYALTYWTGPGPGPGPRTCTWDCPAGQRTVTDRGPYPDPPVTPGWLPPRSAP